MKSISQLVQRSALAAATVATALLAGCTVFPPTVERTRFYSLTPASDMGQLGVVPAADSATIGVRVVSVASHLRRSAMVVRTGEHEVRFADDNRWAEKLDETLGRAFAAGVQRAAGSRIHVSTAPALRSSAPDVLIEIDLLGCEGRIAAEPSAVLVADWRVFHGRDEKPAASGRFRVEKPGWDGADFSQLAALLSSAVDDLAQAVAGPALEVAAE